LIAATVLPILVIPDREFEWDEAQGLDECDLGLIDDWVRTVLEPSRQARRKRMRPGRVIAIKHPLPQIKQAHDFSPASLHDCDQLLNLLLRRKANSLGRREREEIGRALRINPAPVPASTLTPGAATWLLWAMSWRGVSTARQIASPPLHAPTLVIQWWSSMPGPLRFGPAGQLLRVLGDCAARTYRFWGQMVRRMRASGWYVLNPRIVRIRFRPQLLGSNSTTRKTEPIVYCAFACSVCRNLPTMDKIVVSSDHESRTCIRPQRRLRPNRRQTDIFASAD
jgi:hypothetical protein